MKQQSGWDRDTTHSEVEGTRRPSLGSPPTPRPQFTWGCSDSAEGHSGSGALSLLFPYPTHSFHSVSLNGLELNLIAIYFMQPTPGVRQGPPVLRELTANRKNQQPHFFLSYRNRERGRCQTAQLLGRSRGLPAPERLPHARIQRCPSPWAAHSSLQCPLLLPGNTLQRHCRPPLTERLSFASCLPLPEI